MKENLKEQMRRHYLQWLLNNLDKERLPIINKIVHLMNGKETKDNIMEAAYKIQEPDYRAAFLGGAKQAMHALFINNIITLVDYEDVYDYLDDEVTNLLP